MLSAGVQEAADEEVMEADEEVMEEGDRVNQAEVGQLYLSNNATGYLGVYRDGDRFQAKFMRGGKTTYLGHFGTAVEAAVAYVRHVQLHSVSNSIVAVGARSTGRPTGTTKEACRDGS